jgi:hypothetical protein
MPIWFLYYGWSNEGAEVNVWTWHVNPELSLTLLTLKYWSMATAYRLYRWRFGLWRQTVCLEGKGCYSVVHIHEIQNRSSTAWWSISWPYRCSTVQTKILDTGYVKACVLQTFRDINKNLGKNGSLTFLWYDTDCIESETSTACIRCIGNVSTAVLPEVLFRVLLGFFRSMFGTFLEVGRARFLFAINPYLLMGIYDISSWKGC